MHFCLCGIYRHWHCVVLLLSHARMQLMECYIGTPLPFSSINSQLSLCSSLLTTVAASLLSLLTRLSLISSFTPRLPHMPSPRLCLFAGALLAHRLFALPLCFTAALSASPPASPPSCHAYARLAAFLCAACLLLSPLLPCLPSSFLTLTWPHPHPLEFQVEVEEWRAGWMELPLGRFPYPKFPGRMEQNGWDGAHMEHFPREI